MSTIINIFALVGTATIATGAYHLRWLFHRETWKRGTPFLHGPWGGGAQNGH